MRCAGLQASRKNVGSVAISNCCPVVAFSPGSPKLGRTTKGMQTAIEAILSTGNHRTKNDGQGYTRHGSDSKQLNSQRQSSGTDLEWSPIRTTRRKRQYKSVQITKPIQNCVYNYLGKPISSPITFKHSRERVRASNSMKSFVFSCSS